MNPKREVQNPSLIVSSHGGSDHAVDSGSMDFNAPHAGVVSSDAITHNQTGPATKTIEISLAGMTPPGRDGQAEFDFKSQEGLSSIFAHDYLRQFYNRERPVTDDETAVYNFIRTVVSERLTGEESCIEIGCGPTVHHAIMLSPFVKSLTMSDYLDGNLRFVTDWKNHAESAWDWSTYTEFCIRQDGESPSADRMIAREATTRNKVRSVLPINILSEHPLGEKSAKFDVVSAFYCTEEVALTIPRWQMVMSSVASLINDGGFLLMSCLYNSDFYHILSADNQTQKLPCAKIDDEILRSTLEELGFIIGPDSIQVVATPEQEAEGVPGVVLVFAQKRIPENALT